jgi:hypothetical protein
MQPEEKESLTDAQQNVENLRNELAQHEFAGTKPRASLIVELKMAELLLKLESIDTMSVKHKVMYKV